MKIHEVNWPAPSAEHAVEEEQYIFDLGDDSDEEDTDPEVMNARSDELYFSTNRAELSEQLELVGQGQPRYRMEADETLCCSNARKKHAQIHCENTTACLYCRARQCTRSNDNYGLDIGLTAARLLTLAEKDN